VIDKTPTGGMAPTCSWSCRGQRPRRLAGYKGRGIIANPNARPSRWWWRAADPRGGGIKRVVVSTSATPAPAREGMDELLNTDQRLFVNQTLRSQEDQGSPSNVIKIDVFMDDGSTKEEWEDGGREQRDPRPQDQGPRDLRARDDLIGHAEAVNLELERRSTSTEETPREAAAPGGAGD